MSSIEKAAREYIDKGWVPLAQGDTPDGRVGRKPIYRGWNRLSLTDPGLRKQGWPRATGIGLLTGTSSGGLCALDIDDEDFARALFSKLVRGKKDFAFQWSPSGAGHCFFREVESSYGGPRTATWEGRQIKVDLKANYHHEDGGFCGASLTVWPTPGYLWASKSPPPLVETLGNAWNAVCLAMGATPAPVIERPEPWQEWVGDGNKNDSLYSEARALALARMPYERAIELLRLNMNEAYSRTINKVEFEQTVRSAYRRFWPKTSIATDPRYQR